MARQKSEEAPYDRMNPAAKGTSCAPATFTYCTMTLGHPLSCQTHTTGKLTNPFDFFFPIYKTEHSNHPACNVFGEFLLTSTLSSRSG